MGDLRERVNTINKSRKAHNYFYCGKIIPKGSSLSRVVGKNEYTDGAVRAMYFHNEYNKEAGFCNG